MLDYSQIEALLAVDEEGTFEGAARSLNLSSFAVVQRIKSLESKMGVTLLERGPTRTSEAGKVLCDHAREVRALEEQTLKGHRQDSLEQGEGAPIMRIAVNDETLSEWFLQILGADQGSKHSALLNVQLSADQRATELMRSGDVVAALTTGKETVYGFKTFTLGELRYRAVASPAFYAEHFADGVTAEALAKAPALRFCGNDTLIHDWIERVCGKTTRLLLYRYPSTNGALQACLESHAWTMHPQDTSDALIAEGKLVELIPDTLISRMLYWHVARNMLEPMRPITNSLR